MWEKNSNLEKSNLSESPFTKITYHVQVAWLLGQIS
jgi:hypothetical protein